MLIVILTCLDCYQITTNLFAQLNNIAANKRCVFKCDHNNGKDLAILLLLSLLLLIIIIAVPDLRRAGIAPVLEGHCPAPTSIENKSSQNLQDYLKITSWCV